MLVGATTTAVLGTYESFGDFALTAAAETGHKRKTSIKITERMTCMVLYTADFHQVVSDFNANIAEDTVRVNQSRS